MTQLTFEVEGMTCGSCVARVERALREVPGVTNAAVNLVTRRAVVEATAEATAERVREAVVAAGYGVAGGDGVAGVAGGDGDGDGVPDGARMANSKANAANASSSGPEAAEPGAEARGSGVGMDARPGAQRRLREEAEERLGARRAWVAAVLTAPLLVLGMTHGSWEFAESAAGLALQFVLATLVVFGPGATLFRLAGAAAKHRAVDMNTLVAMGSFAAWAASTWTWATTLGSASHAGDGGAQHAVYFEAAATIVTFVLIGRWLEHRARRRLGDAVAGMRALIPDTAARVEQDGSERVVPTSVLRRGDLVRIRPGDRIPADGVVRVGRSVVDESLLTGESVPVKRGLGDSVAAGTIDHEGTLLVEVMESGETTTLARIAAAVEEAQGSKAPIARVADRVAAVFVPIVLGIALATFLVWWLGAPGLGVSHAIERAVAVLVIACPCALGLATPAAVAVGAGRAAELGVLFKNGEALETTARIETLFLDKTGTLTAGKPSVVEILTMDANSTDSLRPTASFAESIRAEDALALAAAVERGSEHPLARAIVAEAKQRNLSLESAVEFESEPGSGAAATVGSKRVRVGTREWLRGAGVEAIELDARARAEEERGRTVVFVAIDSRCVAAIALVDAPAEGARGAIDWLRASGVSPAMLTGDRRGPAESVARFLGIEIAAAEATPNKKARTIESARETGSIVGMVGDGVNDAPALAVANVGFAMGSGTDIAAHAADVTLLRGGIGSIVVAIDLARATLRTIRRNLTFAFGYNVLAIPLAAGVFLPWFGWSLSPMIASAAMALSSISVVLSSLALRSFAAPRIPLDGAR